jgi:hypothetical protein
VRTGHAGAAARQDELFGRTSQDAWEETSMKTQKRPTRPRRDDPERVRRYAEIVALLETTPRPPRPTSLDFACLDGICGRTVDFLMGDFAQHAQWQRRLWLAASDLNGCGYKVQDSIWWLLEAAAAVDAPEKREAALRTIANAYMKPRLSAREYMRRREADRDG